MNSLPRAVFDCNIYLQCIINSRGPASVCLQLAETNKIALYVSSIVIAEIRDLPLHRKLQRLKTITQPRVDRFIDDLLQYAIFLNNIPSVFSYPRDPDDAHYIDLAVAADAKFVVSRDNDLLDLMRRDTPDSVSFRNQFPNLTITDPVGFLAIVAPLRTNNL